MKTMSNSINTRPEPAFMQAVRWAVMLAASCMAASVRAQQDGASQNGIVVTPQACCIVVPTNATARHLEAAQELRKHLGLVTGHVVPLLPVNDAETTGYLFRVGFPLDGDRRPLEREESRWRVTPQGVDFYGDDAGIAWGTPIAVYGFLEEQLGIRWLEPGDAGIAFEPQAKLRLRAGDFRWVPRLVFRKIRQSIRKDEPHRPVGTPFTDPFLLSNAVHNARVADEMLWQRRLRMGGSRPGGAHAFSEWWGRFGQTHPEYIALNKFGKREPVPLVKAEQTESFIKICPSNPKVAEQVVADWLPYKHLTRYVSTGPNDGYNFCECTNCLALDVRREGEAFPGHLTDRYVHLANAVAREIRKHRPDACAALYAYLTTLDPPRRLKLETNVVVHIVPYVDPLDLDTVKAHFEGWKRAGATQLALRPNYHHKYLTTGLPLGIEKQMFDVFQLAVSNGCISADYDSAMGHWAVSGLSDYILARAMADPSKPFAHWEAEYCATYGVAAEDVAAYFRYWRCELWEGRLAPAIHTICEAGKAGNFAHGLMWNLDDYYKTSDFDRTDTILTAASGRTLTERQRGRVRQLLLANEHARLIYESVTAKGQERFERIQALMQFRQLNQNALNLSWVRLIGGEARYANPDIAVAEKLKAYPLPWLQTGMAWSFKMDPDNRGLDEGWEKLSWREAENWEQLRVDSFWEQAYDSETEPGLLKRLKTYDGVAWYASRLQMPKELRDKKILMVFGGVGDACQVYVNGRLAGAHATKSEAGKKVPFTIPIAPAIDWSLPFQTLTVRVDNRSGLGGLYDRIWIVAEKTEQ